MECKSATDLLWPYMLGVLDEVDTALVESHLESCSECTLIVQGDGETIARLAFSVPQWTVPSRIKQKLIRRIEAQASVGPMVSRVSDIAHNGIRSAFRSATTHSSWVLTPSIVVMVILAGIVFNFALGDVAEDDRQRPDQSGLEFERGPETPGSVGPQHEALLMSSSPGASVNMLSGTGPASSARGLIMASRTINRVLLLVVDLPPLPYDRVYQVWLIKNNRRYNSGWFTVDSTGYGQTVIIPVAPFWEFDAAGITIEPSGGSIDPTGANVLKGDL